MQRDNLGVTQAMKASEMQMARNDLDKILATLGDRLVTLENRLDDVLTPRAPDGPTGLNTPNMPAAASSPTVTHLHAMILAAGRLEEKVQSLIDRLEV